MDIIKTTGVEKQPFKYHKRQIKQKTDMITILQLSYYIQIIVGTVTTNSFI